MSIRVLFDDAGRSFDISALVEAAMKGSEVAQRSDTMMRFRKVVADAVKAHVAKAHGNPASRQSEFETPSTSKPSNTPRLNAGAPPLPADWSPKAYEQGIRLLMEQGGLTRDEAETAVYRASKKFTSPAIHHASTESVAADGDDESAEKRFARLQKSHPRLSADEIHTMAHREERMRKLGF